MARDTKDSSAGPGALRATARAHAKVNLSLRITGLRPDGYHELRSLVCPVDLCDLLSVSLVPGAAGMRLRVSGPVPDVPEDESNLAWRAAALFFKSLGRTASVDIDLAKRIPAGAGLGGGSSDAGTLLRVLNDLFKHPFSLTELMAMGARLGADVPFFVYGKPALMEGIGEILTPIEGIIPRPLVILHPGVHLSTAAVYSGHTLALTRPEKTHRFRILKEGPKDGPDLLWQVLENDLEKPALALCPEIGEAKDELARQGACAALMTGSGSAVYGFFADDNKARRAAGEISSRKPAWFVHAGRLLADE